MGRPRADAHDVTTTERLLRAAELEFGRAGYHGARLEDIAGEADITRPSLLYHFASKDALYSAVIRRAFERVREVLSAALETRGPFSERFDRAVEAYLALLDEHPALSQLLLRELVEDDGPGRERVAAEIPPLLDWIERVVRTEGRREVRPGLPIRAAALQIASGAILSRATGGLRERLWGSRDYTRLLARMLFLEE